MSLRISRTDGITCVTIDRPDARNAVDPATAQALFDAFLAFEVDTDAHVAILTGSGGAFCAGFDLKTAADGSAKPYPRIQVGTTELTKVPSLYNDGAWPNRHGLLPAD